MELAAAALKEAGAAQIDLWKLVSQADRRASVRRANPLSKREQDILLGIANGLSNEQIGRRLHISGSTVKTYLNRAFEKTGTQDRTRAVVQAMNNGWIFVPYTVHDEDEDMPPAGD
jgi:DNA-binding NarL/FixJ family response regulator